MLHICFRLYLAASGRRLDLHKSLDGLRTKDASCVWKRLGRWNTVSCARSFSQEVDQVRQHLLDRRGLLATRCRVSTRAQEHAFH